MYGGDSKNDNRLGRFTGHNLSSVVILLTGSDMFIKLCVELFDCKKKIPYLI